MLTLEEARAAILAEVSPATARESVTLSQAHGRFVAQELRARVDNPAFDNSAMDGYALRAADLVVANFVLPRHGECRCGDAPGRLSPGTAMRIFTGAPMPEGADTIVIQEDVRLEGDKVVFPQTAQPGSHLRRRGEDFRRDDLLYPPGRRLSAFDLALLSTAGVADIPVCARARALVVATGDELVTPGTPLRAGQIYESNSLATQLLLRELGAEAVNGGTVRDDPAALRELLKSSTDFDFVITSGGASVGDHDLVKQVFAEIGEIKFWKVKIKPGKPIAFGRVGSRTHFFALPGNPVSSLVTFKLFVEPAVVAWHHGTSHMLQLSATASNDFRRHPGRTEFLRARLATEGGKLTATALRGQGSHMLGPIRETNGFIRVEADSAGFRQGESVVAIPLSADIP
ncbi:MAG: molybdopterin molybdotransferase MoeA [Gammaproteobacteria bacterium]|nr:molybdopterin molybdotransferase MoeA [Gammaproteobacteria bacterium]